MANFPAATDQIAQTQAAHKRTLDDVPGPKGLPIFGNVFQIKTDSFHLTLQKWARQYGGLAKIRFGKRRLLLLSDAALIAQALRDRPDGFRRGAHMAEILGEMTPVGVFAAEGEAWRRQRKLAMRALTPEVIRRFFPQLKRMTERLRARWQKAASQGNAINMHRDLKAFTLDVTVALAMGQDINSLENEDNPLQKDIDTVFRTIGRRLTAPLPYWHYIKLGVDREAERARQRIYDAIAGFIEDTRTTLRTFPERRESPTNLLEAFVATRDEEGSDLTDDDVIGNAITMVFAGEDTTSNTMAWLLDFVARKPDVARMLAEETDAVLDPQRVVDEFSKLDAFPYLDAAAAEAMRLKPVAPVLILQALKDQVIGDVLVPEGTGLCLLTREPGEQEVDFPAHKEFKPERWLGKEAHASETDRKLFPFGGGPRFCPGRFLAMTEIRMVISMIVKNFVLHPVQGEPSPREVFVFTVSPESLPVSLRVRE